MTTTHLYLLGPFVINIEDGLIVIIFFLPILDLASDFMVKQHQIDTNTDDICYDDLLFDLFV